MKRAIPPGTAVHVHMDDGSSYEAQVMFTHFGNPQRVMVAWLGDTPPGHHDVADWVEAERCRYDTADSKSSSGGGGSSLTPAERGSP
jgi:hypothetical protein